MRISKRDVRLVINVTDIKILNKGGIVYISKLHKGYDTNSRKKFRRSLVSRLRELGKLTYCFFDDHRMERPTISRSRVSSCISR